MAAYYQQLGDIVALTAISKVQELKPNGKWNYAFSCAYYDAEQEFLSVTSARFITRYLVHCDLPKIRSKIPENVILFRNDSDFNQKRTFKNPPWTVPVVNNRENPGTLQGEMAVCIKILWGNMKQFNWIMVVQFFEYYKMQNVSKIFVRVRSKDMDPHIWEILDYYQTLGLADVQRWDTNNYLCDRGNEYCYLAQQNDCVFKMLIHTDMSPFVTLTSCLCQLRKI